MSFGYYRSEVLGALFSTLIIWVLTGVLVYLAILRVIDQTFEIEPIAMVATASLGVVFNIAMYFILHTNKCFNGIDIGHHGHSHSGDGHGHGHGSSKKSNHGHSHDGKSLSSSRCSKTDVEAGHGHSHDHNSHGHSHNESNHNHIHAHSHSNSNSNSHKSKKANKDRSPMPITDNYTAPVVDDTIEIRDGNNISDSSNINLRAAAIHVIGDFIQSIGVLVAALVIYFKVIFFSILSGKILFF